MGLLPLPGWLRRNDQAVPEQEHEAEVDGSARLAEATNGLSVCPTTERLPMPFLDQARAR